MFASLTQMSVRLAQVRASLVQVSAFWFLVWRKNVR
jgi:hypothetical protein